MIERLISLTLKNRLLMVLLLVGVVIFGVVQYRRLPTDAFPDISPVMVPVFAEAHGMAPEEVERLITFPIESSMNGLPGVRLVKSTSAFGMAVIYVYFEDDVDIYFARQIVAERLTGAMAELPEMHEPPALGPISTGLGEVFMYYLTADPSVDTGGKATLTWLREINDWVVKYQLQAVPGVTDILSMGGHVLQYQIRVNPYALRKYDLDLGAVVDAVTANNSNAGGQFVVLGSEEYLVRGMGLVESLEDLRRIQLKVQGGTPVLLGEVAEVAYGEEVRRGVVTLRGEEEVVAGIVMKLYGENTSRVIERLDRRMEEVQASLPPGVHLVPYYNQSRLVENATGTVKHALMIGALLVAATLFFFLGNLRSAIIVVLALPLCALIAFIFMGLGGLSANLMSLGGVAIAIGMLGDASIVMVENIYRNLSDPRNKLASKAEVIVHSAREVARPIVFSVAIIILVLLPLFTLEGVEGKMFSPMAFTVTLALLGSAIVAVFFAPALGYLLLSSGGKGDSAAVRALKRLYRPVLLWAIRRKAAVLALAAGALAATLVAVPFLGTEFIPVLEEGIIQINVTMAPSISLEKAAETIMTLERRLMTYPQVEQVISKIGRPEAGSHPHPVNTAHIQVELKPRKSWEEHRTKAGLVEAMSEDLSRYPGVQLNFSQPIQNLFDELLSGVRTQLAIKVYGDDLETLRKTAEEIRTAIDGVPGLADLATEQSFGQPQVQVIADRRACARYDVNVGDILELVELGVGGETIDQVYLNTRRFGIHIRYQERYRDDPEAIGNLLVPAAAGHSVPLSQVAEIREVIGPIQVNRENNQRLWTVSANVRGRDIGGVVSDIRSRIEDRVEIPSGYWIEYGGQFENQQRAMRRLGYIVPMALGLIFLMLYFALGAFRSAWLIFLNVPLALIGGVAGLLITGEFLSVPASVGFIALFGIAVQDGLVLVTYVNQLRETGVETAEAVVTGAMLRLRPVLMTTLTTVLGLLPLLISSGMGSEVQRPLAVVVVFGMLSSTFLTLVLLPALYPWFAPRLAVDR
jgi:cobalt-zinc-cadmium resistance protein CzcA